MRTTFLYFLLIIFAACQNPMTQDSCNHDGEFELHMGERVEIGRDKASIEFVDVLEDSRCPTNVTCVWAGNGKVKLRFMNHELQLNTYLEPHDTTISKSKIKIISLDPYPEYLRQLEKEDYKVRLLITKK